MIRSLHFVAYGLTKRIPTPRVSYAHHLAASRRFARQAPLSLCASPSIAATASQGSPDQAGLALVVAKTVDSVSSPCAVAGPSEDPDKTLCDAAPLDWTTAGKEEVEAEDKSDFSMKSPALALNAAKFDFSCFSFVSGLDENARSAILDVKANRVRAAVAAYGFRIHPVEDSESVGERGVAEGHSLDANASSSVPTALQSVPPTTLAEVEADQQPPPARASLNPPAPAFTPSTPTSAPHIASPPAAREPCASRSPSTPSFDPSLDSSTTGSENPTADSRTQALCLSSESTSRVASTPLNESTNLPGVKLEGTRASRRTKRRRERKAREAAAAASAQASAAAES